MKSVAAMELELLRLRSENKTLRELVLWIQETVDPPEGSKMRERFDLALAETNLVELEIQTPAN